VVGHGSRAAAWDSRRVEQVSESGGSPRYGFGQRAAGVGASRAAESGSGRGQVVKLLTIESTCDETAAAIVTDELQVLSSVVASQDHLHQRFGGVVPEIASRAHVERILPVIDEALRKANLTLADLDAVAVANTPGLAGSLLIGLTAAKGIALACG